jgi:hypothetical protein
MNPFINILLIVPAILIIGTIFLIRIKGRLENNVYRYRHEGLVLQTSLVLLRIRREGRPWRLSLGLAILTNERLIIFNWRNAIIFDCSFLPETQQTCSLKSTENTKGILVGCDCDSGLQEISLRVRNVDAWVLEFSRLCPAKKPQ